VGLRRILRLVLLINKLDRLALSNKLTIQSSVTFYAYVDLLQALTNNRMSVKDSKTKSRNQ
jgi:hypothetical protein